jgi:cystathionine gamma-synthase
MKAHLATRAARAAIDTDPAFGAVMPPLHLSTTFSFTGLGGKRRYDYTRTANPTRDQLAEAIAALEEGAGAVVTASGMAAVALVLELLKPGERLIAPHDAYGGTHRLFSAWAAKRRFELTVLDFHAEGALEQALARPARLVWVETPSNPLLRITDIAAVCQRAHAAGALVVVDNTFLSPALQQPLRLGADLVVHSTTKYLNGHSDVVGGAVVARDPALLEPLAWWANAIGLGGAPFDAYLTLRGLRTLEARMRVHEHNAARIARRLAAHPAVTRVHYPGLPSHPAHALAARQQSGFGAIVSLELEGGLAAAEAFVSGLRCFTLAESLGGVESLVCHPFSMTHAAMPEAARRAAGIHEGLLRLSVGIEAAEDLLTDLALALDRAARVAIRPLEVHG